MEGSGSSWRTRFCISRLSSIWKHKFLKQTTIELKISQRLRKARRIENQLKRIKEISAQNSSLRGKNEKKILHRKWN
jgi:hypothetical protein